MHSKKAESFFIKIKVEIKKQQHLFLAKSASSTTSSRSMTTVLMEVQVKHEADEAFEVMAPKLFNPLPLDLRSVDTFRKKVFSLVSVCLPCFPQSSL